MPRGSSNTRRTTSNQKMEDTEPYLDLTYGAGGEQQYADENDDDDEDDNGDDNYYYDDVQQQPQAQHGFVSGSSMFQQSNHPFDDPYSTSTTTNMGMNGGADDDDDGDDADADMNNNFEVDNDEDMEQDTNSMNRNNHHEELFHYEHTQQQQPPPPPPSQSLSQGSHSASGVEEHTGRWTKEEHEAFLQGLKLYGKEWKKVAAKVRTRTVVQTRTHAQKYFQKLQKSIQDSATNKRRAGGSNSHNAEYGDDMRDGQYAHDDETQRMIAIMNSNNSLNDDDNEDNEDGFTSTAVFSTASTRGRGSSTRGRGGRRGAAANNTSSGSKAALSKKGFGLTQPQPLLPPPPVTAMNIMKNNIGAASINQTPSHQLRRGSTATLNAAQVISTLSSAKTGDNNTMKQQTAGSIIHSTPSRVDHKNYFTSNNNNSTSTTSSNMKITAPDPSRMGRHYAFPEPSPAATGKRKLAEIAAAQMLAGVISSSSKVSSSSTSSINRNINYNQNPLNTTSKIDGGNPIDFSMSDGPPTPPMATSSFVRNSMLEQQQEAQQRPLDLNEAPPLPPLFSSSKNNSISTNKPTLHIVNPDLFGIVPSMQRSNDPVTPWDNDLAALVDSTTTNSMNGIDDDEIDVNELLNTAMNVLDSDNATFPSQTSTLEDDELPQLPQHQQSQQQHQQQEQYIHPILGPVDGYSRTPLHQAICAQDEETVQTLLDVIGTQSKDLNQNDTAGYTPLHSACAAAMATSVNESSEDDEENNHVNDAGDESNIKPNNLVRMLLQAGCNPYLYDSDGNTPLHWSVRACDYDATQQLIQHIISTTMASKDNIDTKSSTTSSDIPTIELYLNVQNQFGETCMHWAARGGIRCCDPIAALLLSHSASTDIMNKSLKRPTDVAADGYVDEPFSVECIRSKQKTSTKIVNPTINGDGNNKKKASDSNKELMDAIQRTLQDRCATRAFLMYHSKSLRTLVLHHPECLDHHPKSISDWETPDRVKTILQRLENNASSMSLPGNSTSKTNTAINNHEIVLSQEFDRGNLELLSRVHSTEYLSFVNQLSKDLERKLAAQGNHSSFNDNDGMSEDTKAKNNITKWGLQISSSSLPVVPFTPMVQRTMIKVDESNVKLSDNSDTSFSVGSLRAARRAAGAVQHAIDCVLTGKNRNAFCIVRPPGHHAGVNGLLEGGESCGFCIFNNVAAGAMHALAEHKDICQRVAIVDIDVHHGNGTEEIVRKCNDPSTLFFFSIHLFDNDEVTAQQSKKKNHQIYKFYPGTGSSDDLAMNIINVPIMPLWKDLSHIQSKACEPKTHNTRKKLRSNTSMALSENTNDDSSEPSTPRINSGATSSSRNSDGESSTATTVQQQQFQQHSSTASTSAMVPMTTAVAGTILTLPGRNAYRQAIQSRLLPSLRAFNPNLILISAGFDASSGDVGNARHEKDRERMGIDLLPEDYAWTTRQILHIANICCNGRVVSILEGGYGRTPLSETTTTASSETMTAAAAAVTAKEQVATTLDRHIFGECAIRHLHAMIDPYDVEQRFG